MSFSCGDIEQYYDAQMAVHRRYAALAAAYAGLRLENETARAFASEGFLRRLELMQQCIGGYEWDKVDIGTLLPMVKMKLFGRGRD